MSDQKNLIRYVDNHMYWFSVAYPRSWAKIWLKYLMMSLLKGADKVLFDDSRLLKGYGVFDLAPTAIKAFQRSSYVNMLWASSQAPYINKVIEDLDEMYVQMENEASIELAYYMSFKQFTGYYMKRTNNSKSAFYEEWYREELLPVLVPQLILGNELLLSKITENLNTDLVNETNKSI